MEGRFEGIGIEFHRVLDTAIVLNVISGGPAERSGVEKYDRIISANDSSMIAPDMTEADMVKFLRGEKSSIVLLDIARRGVDSLIRIEIERDFIPIKSIESAYIIRDNIGYIRIRNFTSRTYKEFMEHVERLTESEGMRDLIIDVRQNPGGYLKEAVNILSQLFEEKGLLLVYTEGEHAARTEYKSTGKPFYPLQNLVVLVDEGSASASEILAGALQDHDRAVIVGSETFGKGLVQEQYSLSNGGALRLTIARYFTPSGRLIQRPYDNGESVADNGQSESDTLQYYTTKGRTVSGSGGITPDIHVEWGWDWHNEGMLRLYNDVLEFAFVGYEHETKYDSVDDLISRFPDEAKVVAQMAAHFKSDTARVDLDNLHEHSGYARMLLMAMIATDQFGQEGWRQVINSEDPVVNKALDVIKEDLQITLKLD